MTADLVSKPSEFEHNGKWKKEENDGDSTTVESVGLLIKEAPRLELRWAWEPTSSESSLRAIE